jgi:hypothetical protein
MKELSRNATEVTVTAIVAASICAVVLGFMASCTYTNKLDAETKKEFIRNGYIEMATPGSYNTHWEKPPGK